MGNIILAAESGADIPPEVARRYNIQIVPMHVAFGETTRADGSFPPEEICAYYERTKDIPKTGGCTPEDFRAAFDGIHARWPEAQILYLAYSSATTCSYQSAQIAAADRDYVTNLDTKAVTAGQYSIVMQTAELLETHPDWTIAQAVEAARKFIQKSRMCFIPNDMKYLRAGGRVSNAAALCGDLLGIHPVIEIRDGRLIAVRKMRGRMEKLAPRLVAEYAEESRLNRNRVWFLRGPGFAEETRLSVEQSARACGFREITWVRTGGVITVHGGPGVFGMAGFSDDLT